MSCSCQHVCCFPPLSHMLRSRWGLRTHGLSRKVILYFEWQLLTVTVVGRGGLLLLLCCCCSYCAPALASSAYALAVLKFRPPRAWAQTLLSQSQRQMPAFGAQELSNLVWALAVLGLRPGAAWLREFEVQVGAGAWLQQHMGFLCRPGTCVLGVMHASSAHVCWTRPCAGHTSPVLQPLTHAVACCADAGHA